jgi:hypothetical protein
MAKKIEDYTQSTPPSGGYPYGSFKNATSPTSFDGTPADKDWANDWYGFLSKILNDAGITPSGTPDTILASDYFDGMVKLFSKYLMFDDTGSADDYELDAVSGANPEAYTDGIIVQFKAATNNTGASTIEIGTLGAKALVDRGGSALVGGEVLAGEYIVARYDSGGDDFEIVLGPSTTTIRGLVELSTNAEAVTGTDTVRAVTPAALTARLAAPGTIGGTTPNTAIFTTLTVNTALDMPNGTVSAPGAYFSGDSNTGFYKIGADSFGISINGADAIHWLSTGVTEWGTFSSTGVSLGKLIQANHVTADSSHNDTTTFSHYRFFNQNGQVGSIQTNLSATIFNTSSARELKTVLGNIENALEIVNSWRPYTGYFNADGPDNVTRFFIADEMQETCPNTVSGEGKEMQMAYGGAEIITTMAAAIQELSNKLDIALCRIEEVEAK